MKCRLQNKSRCDEDFQIEFESLSELKDLKNSLNAMIKYIVLCKKDGEELPELVYRIKNNLKTKKDE
jgi:hypothetical protein